MVRNTFFSFFVFCCFFMVTACNANKGKSTAVNSEMRDTLRYTGCQEEIRLKAGSVFEISLEAIKGTGYQWLLKDPCPLLQPVETDVLKYISDEESIPGQKSWQVLQFKAMKKGESVIQLEYKRVFEKGIEKSCTIKMVIE